MKKVLSLVLVTLMILACVPMSVFGAVATTDVCKIGDVGYATLNAAIDAVKDGETIVLVKDATLTKLRQDAIDYTIDGQNKAYTVDIPSGTYYTGSANITFKGVNIDMGTTSQALLSNDAQQTGDVTFDNCHVKTYNDSGYKLNGRGNFTIKNGSLWEKMTGTNAVFFFQVDHEFNEDECIVTVDNSTVVNYAGSTNTHQTNNIFHWYSGVSSPIKFYFKGNTILKNASTVANATRTCLFYINNAASSVEIHCDSTVEFIVAPTAKAQGNFIYNTNANAAVTIYGVPKLTANDAVAANEGSFPGIYFPYNMDGVYSADGSIKYTKWTDGTNTYNFNSKYTGSAASFYPVADATATEGKVAFIKDKRGQNLAYYATLDAAIAAVADGETIVLIKNGTLSAFNQNAINYKIDGQNKTYTIQTGAVDIGIGNGNVTFKNVKIDLGAGSAKTTWRNAKGTNGDITFIGCQINAYNNSHYRLEGLGNFTLKNSSWDKMTGGATAFYANGTSVNPAENECNFIVEAQ